MENIVDEQINQGAESLAYAAKNTVKVLALIEANRKVLEELNLSFSCSVYGGIQFSGLSHEDSVRVFKAFSGKWSKEYNNDSINYTNEEHNPQVTIYYSKPPANCKIEEYNEVVPEHTVPETTVIKRKVVCQKVEGFDETSQEVLDAALSPL